MNKWLGAAICLILVFSMAGSGYAASISADGSYLLGSTTVGGEKTNQQGFLVGVDGELYSNIMLEGRFLSIAASGQENTGSQSLISGSLAYRVLQEADLEVLVGAGYTVYTSSLSDDADAKENGSGLYGKLGVKFRPGPKLAVVGDVTYAPGLKFAEDNSKPLLTGRLSLSYEVLHQLSVQGTVMRLSIDSSETSSVLYGGGIFLQF